MGTLAFIAITLSMTRSQPAAQQSKVLEFQWIGAPVEVKPLFVYCQKGAIHYFDIFTGQHQSATLHDLFLELQGKQFRVLSYFKQVAHYNQQLKHQFKSEEHYPLLLVYADGILASELLMSLIENVEDLHVGLEPMRSDWKTPNEQ